MPFWYCRLDGPRPTFPADMTADEAAVMQAHGAYWRTLAERGSAVVVGPVVGPDSVFGMVVVEAGTEADVLGFLESDPVTISGSGFKYSLYPMPQVILRATPPAGR